MTQKRKHISKVSAKPSSKKKDIRFKITILRNRCKGCGLCVKYCATGTIEMSDEVNSKGNFIPVVKDIRTCKGCDLCTKYCPDFAIFCTKIRDNGK